MEVVRSIKKSDFFKQNSDKEKILFLLEFAVLAPSYYNSQPWLFKIEDNKCTVLLDPKIQLKESDPDLRNLYISLGCAIENIVIIAKYFGVLEKTESVFDNGKYSATNISFVFNKESTRFENAQKLDKDYEKLSDYILRRHSSSGFFQGEVVPPDIISRLSTIPFLDEFRGLRLDFLTNKDQIAILGKVLSDGIIKKFKEKPYRKEFSRWVHGENSKKDGLLRSSLNLKGLFSSIVALLINIINVGPYLARSEFERIKSAPVVCVLGVSEEDNQLIGSQFVKNTKTKEERWINTGRLTERILLEFSARGFDASFFGSAVMLGDLYKEVQKVIGMTERPQLIFGVGHILSKYKFTLRHDVKNKISLN